MRLDEKYDELVSGLEHAVAAGGMSVAGALARAFILGMNYQRECNEQSAANALEGAAEQASLAIAQSKLRNETVELRHSSSCAETLLVECEGHDDNGTYWGVDCDGNEWQVRLV